MNPTLKRQDATSVRPLRSFDQTLVVKQFNWNCQKRILTRKPLIGSELNWSRQKNRQHLPQSITLFSPSVDRRILSPSQTCGFPLAHFRSSLTSCRAVPSLPAKRGRHLMRLKELPCRVKLISGPMSPTTSPPREGDNLLS